MTRTSNTPNTRKKRKKIIRLARGYIGSKHSAYRAAREQLMRSWAYAYRDRKQKKRVFRRLWILRLNNSLKKYSVSYSKFTHFLKLSHVHLNRKQLSEMAINEPKHFGSLVNQICYNKEKNSNLGT